MKSTGRSPFSLMYGVEAVITAEINLCSARVVEFAPAQNDELMVKHLDLLEGYWELAIIRLVKYQQKLAQR